MGMRLYIQSWEDETAHRAIDCHSQAKLEILHKMKQVEPNTLLLLAGKCLSLLLNLF